MTVKADQKTVKRATADVVAGALASEAARLARRPPSTLAEHETANRC